jgi:hypothetical protein
MGGGNRFAVKNEKGFSVNHNGGNQESRPAVMRGFALCADAISSGERWFPPSSQIYFCFAFERGANARAMASTGVNALRGRSVTFSGELKLGLALGEPVRISAKP